MNDESPKPPLSLEQRVRQENLNLMAEKTAIAEDYLTANEKATLEHLDLCILNLSDALAIANGTFTEAVRGWGKTEIRFRNKIGIAFGHLGQARSFLISAQNEIGRIPNRYFLERCRSKLVGTGRDTVGAHIEGGGNVRSLLIELEGLEHLDARSVEDLQAFRVVYRNGCLDFNDCVEFSENDDLLIPKKDFLPGDE